MSSRPKPKPAFKNAPSSLNLSSKKDGSKDKDGKVEKDIESKAMPPPPPPANNAHPPPILSPEIDALTNCLKNAITKTGKIFQFYANVNQLGISNYVSQPPQSLVSALGRDVEKYDQLCDVMEMQILRAISILQRDLQQEENRIKEEEAAKRAEPPRTTSPAPIDDEAPSAIMGPPPAPSSATTPTGSPLLGRAPSRRQSIISMSALQRPQARNYPALKLDLSAPSLRMTAEEAAMFSSSLTSPVTLAPKSARPMQADEYDTDFMAALTSAGSDGQTQPTDTIDLTSVPDVEITGAGSTAEQPIELDLDGMDMSQIDAQMSMDLFGDAPEPAAGAGATGDSGGLFTPALGSVNVKSEEDDNFLSSLQGNTDDLFGSLDGDASSSNADTMAPAPTVDLPEITDNISTQNSTSALFGTDPSQLQATSSNDDAIADLNNFDFNMEMDMNMGLGEMGEMSVDPLMSLEGLEGVDVDMPDFMNMGVASELNPDSAAPSKDPSDANS